MSDFFKGVTFPWQEVTPSDDAIVRRAVLPDRRLSGCLLSYSGYTLTMTSGSMIVCGRQLKHTANQSWTINGAASGYARLLLTIDVTKASTESVFDQASVTVEYADAPDGFPVLRQEDINTSGVVYQLPICVVSLSISGISGFYYQIASGAVGASDLAVLSVFGGAMNGPINMDGNVIVGLPDPAGYDQPVPYRMFLEELAKKAPAGFGLGGNGQFLDSGTNFDDVTGSGFYSWNNGCINSPFDWGTMIAVSRHGGPVQLALGHDGEARDQIAIRSLSQGTSNWQYLMKRFNLLWQNASPNSLFGAQTISVDLSAYDTVMIAYNQYYENNNVAMCFVPKFCYGQLETVMSSGRYRTLLVSNDGVSFNDQLMADGSAGSNNYCIPYQIFGCKLA